MGISLIVREYPGHQGCGGNGLSEQRVGREAGACPSQRPESHPELLSSLDFNLSVCGGGTLEGFMLGIDMISFNLIDLI